MEMEICAVEQKINNVKSNEYIIFRRARVIRAIPCKRNPDDFLIIRRFTFTRQYANNY